jgi:RNA polymerase sigma-54 factor
MSQQLRMILQLQQAIKLLQLSRMELANLVAQEMVENPALEELSDNYESTTTETQTTEEPQAKTEAPASEPTGEASITDGERKIDENPGQDEMDQWREYLENSTSLPTNSYKGMQDELPSLEATLTKNDDLNDHLMWQLSMAHLTDDERMVATVIIGNIDERGYLCATAEEVSEQAECDPEFVEEVLEIFHEEFDPIGVGARDLRECLLIQAAHLFKPENPIFAVIGDHIPNLEKKRYDSIAKALGLSMDEVISAAKSISKMNPKPGRIFQNEDPQYITPDIHIHKLGDEYIAVINDDGIPKLKVSNFYRDALNKNERNDAKKYIQEKVKSAAWLIQSIYRRQRTIVKVTNSIIKFQSDFLDKGIHYLKPLVLRDIADDIGMHESTISRVTTNKYVHTPQGIFELKFFFNSSISKVQGEDIASEAVKTKIKHIIDQENPKKPMSDSKIVKLLREGHNIDIARRTVAKYRESMGILSSTKRKRLF